MGNKARITKLRKQMKKLSAQVDRLSANGTPAAPQAAAAASKPAAAKPATPKPARRPAARRPAAKAPTKPAAKTGGSESAQPA